MAKSTNQTLENLTNRGISDLKSHWQALTSTDPPPVRKNVLIRILAYKIQEQAYGGLGKPFRQRLNKLAQSTQGGQAPPKLEAVTPAIKIGTRMIREWRGKTFEVTLTDAGYAYRGKHYRSLSEIARLITGTRWSGPVFFGLKQSTASKPMKANHHV